jgi:T5SS/PEP-CTERM-associated repeat protein
MSQIQRYCLILLLFLGNGWSFVSSHAQFTANFQTNLISGGVSNWAGDYVVGSNTYAAMLLIQNGGQLFNDSGYLGYQSGSSNNCVIVTGTGSLWSNSASLYLGYTGARNTLVITNAGRVVSRAHAYLGSNLSSSNNRVLVTDTNSIWETWGITFGTIGNGNSMVISNGGRVVINGNCLMGSFTSSNNQILVTGPGSVLSNNGTYLDIGYLSKSNRLTVNNGGRVICSADGKIGTGESSSNNVVWVSDPGSLWDVSADAMELAVGWFGSRNSLVVTNGAQVKGYYAYIGRTSSNNTVLVTGPGSRWTVQCYTYVGYLGKSNTMILAAGAQATNKFIYINHEAGSSNNTVLVTDTNTSWHNENSVFVGMAGGGGSLTISNGATMSVGGAWGTTHDGALGVEATSANNRALVTGGGSVWKCADSMYVGLNGVGNSLVISNGGRVVDTYGYIGSNHGSDNNQALVVGANSVWTNASDFHVGYFATNNQLVISNGGGVIAGDGSIGRASDSSRNRVIVTGTNSVWRNKTNLLVGCFGPSNSLVVSNAAQVSAVYGYVGYGSDSHDNHASVSGTGSVWTNSNATLIGNLGSSNTMTIRAGGLVSDYWGIIGDADESFDNTVYVEPGGTWRTHRLLVGHYGSHNALYVNGGAVFAGTTMDVGFDPVYPNNLAQLNSGEINVTNAAHNAVLEVYGGSFVLLGGILRVDTLIATNSRAQFLAMGGTLSYRSLQLTPGFDVDTDGLPNGWEQMYALNPLDPFDAENDSDGDQMSNLDEFLAGTNPTNAASCLQITSQTISNHSVNVNWKAVGGKSYVVQKSPSPSAGFTDLSPVITIPGTTETTTNYLDAGAATNWSGRYYRIRLEP